MQVFFSLVYKTQEIDTLQVILEQGKHSTR